MVLGAGASTPSGWVDGAMREAEAGAAPLAAAAAPALTTVTLLSPGLLAPGAEDVGCAVLRLGRGCCAGTTVVGRRWTRPAGWEAEGCGPADREEAPAAEDWSPEEADGEEGPDA